jgi:hypothetical protein
VISRLFGPFHALGFLLSCRAGVVPCYISTFADYTFRRKPGSIPSGARPRFMSSYIVAARLRSIALSTDMTVVVAFETLLDSTGAVI